MEVSYDLVFWRQDPGERRSPQLIYEALVDNGAVPGIPLLPVEDFLARLMEAFPGASREPNGPGEWIVWSHPRDGSGFQVEWTSQCVWISCRPLDEGRANKMVDIANAFGCALYDPQVNERFGLP